MLTKNLTPFPFATKLCSRRPPEPEMTVVVRAAFALSPGEPLCVDPELDQGMLDGDRFAEGDDDRVGECLWPSDFADFKLNAEVLVRGTCHVPRAEPVAECPVKVQVGSWSKALRVVGPRAWSDGHAGAVGSKPLAFTRMPLGYANAFGGPGYAKNPAGKGLGRELPNVEDPRAPVTSRHDRPEPAGFGPFSPTWPQRSSKMGTEYGASYRQARAPYFARDFDWTFFSAAPRDQQLPGYLAGDEELVFTNLHPVHPVVSSRLPGIRIRVFAQDRDGLVREVAMVLDTVLADLDESKVWLTFRGVLPVTTDDLGDVAWLLVASEPLGAALPFEHYAAELEAFADDPVGLEKHLPGWLLAPEPSMGEAPASLTADPPPDPLTAEVRRRFGKVVDPEMLERTATAMADARAKAGPATAELEAALAEMAAKPTEIPRVMRTVKPGTLPPAGIRSRMREVQRLARDLRARLAEQDLPAEARAQVTARLDELDALPLDPRWKEMDPSYEVPGPLTTDEPGPGRDLSELDLSHRDLRGADLRGATMVLANLTGANLAGANLAGANLRFATLYKANLEGASLAGADLTLCNAAAAKARGADLREATLEQASFEGADLREAKLDEARGEYVLFDEADLTGASAAGASLDHSELRRSVIERASFAGASLRHGRFERCRGDGADLSGASLEGASFPDAELSRARLAAIRAPRSAWLRACLDEADLGYACLTDAHLIEVSARRAKLFGADLARSVLRQASLEGAEILRANLFGADLCKARLDGARFTGSSLYDAKLLGAGGDDVDLTGANLKRSTLERA